MNGLKNSVDWFVDSGVGAETPKSDARYIRFLNATLLLFGLGQFPILSLLFILGLQFQIIVNLIALSLCAVGYALNRSGYHLSAKVLVIGVVTANTAYFALIMGSNAPAHLWLVPAAVLGVLAFKPSEWTYALSLISFAMISFVLFEFAHHRLEPVVNPFSDPLDVLRSAQGSTVFAMGLTLVLIGMMHRRFAGSEAALSKEKAQSDRLLRAILPDEIADELRTTGATQALRHEDVSLLFADIVGFTPLAASMPAEDVVALLATIFERFDQLIAECGVEKIKTIGDAYMVAGGVPQPTADHAARLARCALGMLEIMDQFSTESGHNLQIRIGLHRGPVVAGVIGTTKFAYDLWGETVNLASRLESTGEAGRVHVSADFRSASEATMKFEPRGEVAIKGMGSLSTHWLVG
jgi:class 3 adenylate cyclase